MDPSAPVTGLACLSCGGAHDWDPTAGRCPDCGGLLDPTYDLDRVDPEAVWTAAGRPMWALAALLPLHRADAVDLGEGGTPLVACPRLADELGVERVLIKDEGRNPSGGLVDRGMGVAVSAAAAAGATAISLGATGETGQSAAAYAARAGVDAHVFVPSRAGFVRKAMINVHGGDMSVVEGRLPAAEAAHAGATADHPAWRSVAPLATPFHRDGLKTLLYEVVAELGAAPDAVVHPTGHGAGLLGSWKAAEELRDLGLVGTPPRLYAAQASGCAPIAGAVDAGEPVEPWAQPDTICAGIEVPAPADGDLVADAVRATGGDGVATDDEAILASAVTVAAHEGVAMTPSGAAAASGAWALADRGAFDPGDTVVLVNAGDGAATADVLRSHLMGRGV